MKGAGLAEVRSAVSIAGSGSLFFVLELKVKGSLVYVPMVAFQERMRWWSSERGGGSDDRAARVAAEIGCAWAGGLARGRSGALEPGFRADAGIREGSGEQPAHGPETKLVDQ